MARLAKVHILAQFDDLDLIEQYAAKFGQDPDWVYYHKDFETIMSFAIKWKEEAEYRERFNVIMEDVMKPPKK